MRFNTIHIILRLFLIVVVALSSGTAIAQSEVSPPRLVVNIVVGSLRAADLNRYRDNFTDGGFNRLRGEGVECTDAQYSYQGGATPTSLATISSGTLPSTHGVVGYAWYEASQGDRVEVSYDKSVKNIPYDIDKGGDSPHRLVTETLTESLRSQLTEARTMTIGLDATSAVVFNGCGGDVLWVDPRAAKWTTSSAYASVLPDWVKRANIETIEPSKWHMSLEPERYKNSYQLGIKRGIAPIAAPRDLSKSEAISAQIYDYLAYTPAGNKRVLDMAFEAVRAMNLGGDAVTDMLNISLDASRNVISRYGVESVEAEDMYYALDRDLALFIENVRSWVKFRDVVFVVTSAGGSSPSTYEVGRDKVAIVDETKRLNTEQFVVILNTFLSSKYGVDRLVRGYENRSIYLDRPLIYESKLSVDDVADDVAKFAMEFRGVSGAITSSAMQSSYFAGGYASAMQRSFYARHSGDVVINLLPLWIERRDGVHSASGSVYRYDRSVPLLIMGSGISSGRVVRRVDMIDVAPTISALIGIEPPMMSDGVRIVEITDGGF